MKNCFILRSYYYLLITPYLELCKPWHLLHIYNIYIYIYIIYIYIYIYIYNIYIYIYIYIYDKYWCKYFRKKVCIIPLGWVRFEPMLAMVAVPNPSESGDITTAPLHLLKKQVSWTVLCLISLNDPSNREYFWCASALIIYKELSGSRGYWSLENIIII